MYFEKAGRENTVVPVAGTGRGADTAAILSANSSNRFFDIKIREILAKPRHF